VIAEIVTAAESRDEEEGTGLSPVMTEHLVCSLNLVRTTCDRLTIASLQFTEVFGLMPRLLTVFVAQSLDQRVRLNATCVVHKTWLFTVDALWCIQCALVRNSHLSE